MRRGRQEKAYDEYRRIKDASWGAFTPVQEVFGSIAQGFTDLGESAQRGIMGGLQSLSNWDEDWQARSQGMRVRRTPAGSIVSGKEQISALWAANYSTPAQRGRVKLTDEEYMSAAEMAGARVNMGTAGTPMNVSVGTAKSIWGAAMTPIGWIDKSLAQQVAQNQVMDDLRQTGFTGAGYQRGAATARDTSRLFSLGTTDKYDDTVKLISTAAGANVSGGGIIHAAARNLQSIIETKSSISSQLSGSATLTEGLRPHVIDSLRQALADQNITGEAADKILKDDKVLGQIVFNAKRDSNFKLKAFFNEISAASGMHADVLSSAQARQTREERTTEIGKFKKELFGTDITRSFSNRAGGAGGTVSFTTRDVTPGAQKTYEALRGMMATRKDITDVDIYAAAGANSKRVEAQAWERYRAAHPTADVHKLRAEFDKKFQDAGAEISNSPDSAALKSTLGDLTRGEHWGHSLESLFKNIRGEQQETAITAGLEKLGAQFKGVAADPEAIFEALSGKESEIKNTRVLGALAAYGKARGTAQQRTAGFNLQATVGMMGAPEAKETVANVAGEEASDTEQKLYDMEIRAFEKFEKSVDKLATALETVPPEGLLSKVGTYVTKVI